MDELVNQVSQRTGLGQDQSRTAVETVVGFLKQRLPGPAGGMIDKALGDQSQQGAEQPSSGAFDAVKGLFKR